MICTQLIHFNEEDEYTTAAANAVKEASLLVEHGFEHITEMDGFKLFRKRRYSSFFL
jgi:hypothetical protein